VLGAQLGCTWAQLTMLDSKGGRPGESTCFVVLPSPPTCSSEHPDGMQQMGHTIACIDPDASGICELNACEHHTSGFSMTYSSAQHAMSVQTVYPRLPAADSTGRTHLSARGPASSCQVAG
jgi:hypothetical protein